MKTILVPTDFSGDAEQAIHFAAELNKLLDYRIMLFTAFNVPVPVADAPVPVITEQEIEENAMSQLHALENKFRKLYPPMHFSVKAELGASGRTIVQQEDESEADFLVIGTHEGATIDHLLNGRHAPYILRKSKIPVIVLPHNAVAKRPDSIVFAVNFGEDDYDNIMQLIDFAAPFNPEIIILHVNTNSNDASRQYAELEKFRELVVEKSKYQKVSFKLLEEKHIYEGIVNYVDEIKADMLVMSMRKKGFIDELLSTSLTTKMAYHSRVPLMVLHTEV